MLGAVKHALALQLLSGLMLALPVSGQPVSGAAAIGASIGADPSLSVVWRVDERVNKAPVLVRSTQAFSRDGRLLGVLDSRGVRIMDSTEPLGSRFVSSDDRLRAHSLAISVDGRIAIGRVGGLHVYGPGARRPSWYACVDPCGPIMALDYSPDGQWLAYQGTRGLDDRRRGLGSVIVLDAASGELIANLRSTAARAFVMFSADGEHLVSSHTTSFDDEEVHGVRVWSTSDWKLVRQSDGFRRKWRAVGTIANSHVGAYFGRDHIEIRDLVRDRLLWSVPLIGPSVASTASGEFPTRRLELIELSPNGEFVLSYESPAATIGSRNPGTIVIREAHSGRVEAMYDAADVTSLAVSPDSRTFLFATGSGQTYRLLARVP
jgi:WD40 repeat protein